MALSQVSGQATRYFTAISTDIVANKIVGASYTGVPVMITDTVPPTWYIINPDQTLSPFSNPTSITSALPTGTNTIGTVNTQTLSGTVLNTPSAAIITTTTSANLTVGNYKELAVDVNISVVTGTTPTYQLMVDRLGADGIYYNIYTGTSITAVGVVSINVGVGASTNVSFGSTIRFREIIGGTTPSFTRSMSIIGK